MEDNDQVAQDPQQDADDQVDPSTTTDTPTDDTTPPAQPPVDNKVPQEEFNKTYGKLKHAERILQQHGIDPSTGMPYQQPAQPAQPYAYPIAEPQADQFESDSEYAKALVKWQGEKQTHEFQVQQAETNRQNTIMNIMQGHDQRVRDLMTQPGFENYQQVVMSPEMQAIADRNPEFTLAMIQHPQSAKLAHYLGTHMNEARRIDALPNPVMKVAELGKIEMMLSKPEVPTVSGAGEPITPVTSGTVVPEKDPAKMTQREYEAWRKKQMTAP